MTSTISKRQQVWVCWQEPEADRGKMSVIPTSWIVKVLTGDTTTPNSLVLCRWPRSEELYTAKVLPDPNPNDLSKSQIIDVPTFMDDQSADTNASVAGIGLTKSLMPMTKNRQFSSPKSLINSSVIGLGAAASIGGSDDNQMLNQLKKFFLGEMTKIGNEMQANFDILGHRIGALEVNMKCVRERVERIENLLNSAVQDLEASEQRNSNLLNMDAEDVLARPIKNETPRNRSVATPTSIQTSRRSQSSVNSAVSMTNNDQSMNNGDQQGHETASAQRATDQRIRRDRNPRPRAVVVTCPRNRNIVYLGGEERYKMALQTYLDAIRHAKRPTATYMVTALIRRYLPAATLAKLCVNERQLANTAGGHLVDQDLLEALKEQARMQFPNTNIVDRELMLRIEDVTRDVRRKLKLKRAAAAANSKQRASMGASSSSTPISMVAQRSAVSGYGVPKRRGGNHSLINHDTEDFLQLNLEDERDAENFDEEPQPLPMFS